MQPPLVQQRWRSITAVASEDMGGGGETLSREGRGGQTINNASLFGGSMKVTQKLLTYNIEDVSSATYTGKIINGPRDLSAMNRKDIMQTTKKGVPLLYRYAVTVYPSIVKSGGSPAGFHLLNNASSGQSQKVVQTIFYGAPNNWVTRNACVKIHNAREAYFKKNGIKKTDRGAYDHTIRYDFVSSPTYEVPKKGVHAIGAGDGDESTRTDITGGEWEATQLFYPGDAGGAKLHLTGTHTSEESTATHTSLCASQLYLSSRGTIDSDSNRESSDTPYDDSVLARMMAVNVEDDRDDMVRDVRDRADSPPYDLGVASNDTYEKVEIGRLQFCVGQAGSATAIIEAPLGIFQMRSVIADTDGDSAGVTGDIEMNVELLGIVEM